MYYIVYGLLYAFSLLPLRVLYLFSDLAYFIVYYLSGYRKKVVLDNLQIAFPEKSENERIKIAKQFYLNFTDTLIESLKMLSISTKELERRGKGEFEYINSLIEKGYSINVMAAHQFNWEFANLIYAKNLKAPFVGIYMPISNKIFDRIFLKFRARYGTVLISAQDFKNKMHKVFSAQYALALAADQNPGNPAAAYWMNFFGRPVPFITGPGKGAVKNNTAVVFVGFHKVKRGYYEFRVTPISEDSSSYTPEQLTLMYKNVVEATIRKDPANYLWSHRRWKWEWKEEYGEIVK
ncbi:MAG: lysophospholipid acyltransferase family protein [Chitinophagaceae bacterium]|nr:lysophospholipid acyltransferase family protein [Chitinophagaceae bacterium]